MFFHWNFPTLAEVEDRLATLNHEASEVMESLEMEVQVMQSSQHIHILSQIRKTTL